MVYPNPASGSVTVDLGSTAGASDILITDAAGRVVFATQISGKRLVEIDALAAGVYILVVKTGQGFTATQLVVE
jgi:hypothetical protein